MPSTPTISVVMPSRNRIERLLDVVPEHAAQGADEIVVVLDGPHPGWREQLAAIERIDVVQIHELPANRGLALARTAGLELATGDVVLMADDDVYPGPGMIDRHRAFHAGTPGSALLGYMPVALPAKRGRDQAPTYVYSRDYANQVEIWQTAAPSVLLESFWGGNASLPRDLYLRAEAFKPSERLNYNEDLDLGMRLGAIGAGAAFDRRAEGAHRHARDMHAFLAECVTRGEAVADMERRWSHLPQQLSGLVEVPAENGRIAGGLQRRIGARDTAGLTEAILMLGYRAFGLARAWRFQDAVARFLRRGLAIRGYRLARR